MIQGLGRREALLWTPSYQIRPFIHSFINVVEIQQIINTIWSDFIIRVDTGIWV
ncbi:hypothetical protein D1AOALGA4SA_1916 [Olavius algarvensis Delta 1 endosymbiont]|nr:hypothetical protein D1AOALGA4SA_1916 [Olavius algarvensis Delta 1 endosymbiont]